MKATLAKHWKSKGVEAKVHVNKYGSLVTKLALAEMPLVSVIILNRNKPALIRTLVNGLLTKTQYEAMEIIIVDNGSTDRETLAFYAEYSQKLNIIPYDEVFNYSRACNLGAAVAKGKFLLFLNNDIEILHADWLEELVPRAVQPGVGVVGAKLLYPDGEIQHAGVVLGLTGLAGHVFHRSPQHGHGVFGSPNVLRNWSAVTGACQLISRSLFEQLDGYDESFSLAYSDINLCFDTVNSGFRIVYTPFSSLIHHESATRGDATPNRDQVLFARIIRNSSTEAAPFFHPRLDGFNYAPQLAILDGRSVSEIRRIALDHFAGLAVQVGESVVS